jgi:hypothetical protein
MTRDEIIQLARQAKASRTETLTCFADEELLTFANLITEHYINVVKDYPHWIGDNAKAMQGLREEVRELPEYLRQTESSGGCMKCPKCGTAPFQHWNYGYMHKCHICNHVWKE